jgi:hypothetical protein
LVRSFDSNVGVDQFAQQQQVAESLWRPKIGTVSWAQFEQVWGPLNYNHAYILFHLVDLTTVTIDIMNRYPTQLQKIYEYRLDQNKSFKVQMDDATILRILRDATSGMAEKEQDVSTIERVVDKVRLTINEHIQWTQFKRLWQPLTYTQAFVLFYFVDLDTVSKSVVIDLSNTLSRFYDKCSKK